MVNIVVTLPASICPSISVPFVYLIGPSSNHAVALNDMMLGLSTIETVGSVYEIILSESYNVI